MPWGVFTTRYKAESVFSCLLQIVRSKALKERLKTGEQNGKERITGR